jgi:hypothetical protein
MTKRRQAWVFSPPRPAKSQVSAPVKIEVEEKVWQLVETVLKPKYIAPPPHEGDSNYLVDIYTKWYRSYLYLCAKYACPGPNALAPFFELKFARLEFIGGSSRFNLAFMRHTGEWIEIYRDLSVDECLTAIKDDPWFQP